MNKEGLLSREQYVLCRRVLNIYGIWLVFAIKRFLEEIERKNQNLDVGQLTEGRLLHIEILNDTPPPIIMIPSLTDAEFLPDSSGTTLSNVP